MSLLKIHVLGAPVLRQETDVVGDVTESVRHLVDDMFETMYAANGIGLAAPQVGRRERVAVVDVKDQRYVLINPQVISGEGSSKSEEGCLSMPELYGDVERPARVVIRAMGLNGQSFDLEAKDLLARCIQHEIDHLHGKLFIDYLSVLRRRMIMGKWEKERVKYPGLLRTIVPGERSAKSDEDF